MRRGWSVLAAGAALCAGFACESEVTVHLLRVRAEVGGAFPLDAGAAGAAPVEAGAGGTSGDTASADAGAGDAGGPPQPPCQKLGAEVCNGADDDCNDVVDDGCAFTVLWKTEADSAALGHATGGVMFFEPCPRGSLLTGLRVGMGNWLNQVAAVCRQAEVRADTTHSPVAISAALGARIDTSYAPAASMDTTNKTQDFLCPDGSVLTGVGGATAPEEAHYIRNIRLTCAPLTISSSGSLSILDSDRSQEKNVGPLNCIPCSGNPTLTYSYTVPQGQVATRIFGADGLWVDRVGFGASLGSIVAR